MLFSLTRAFSTVALLWLALLASTSGYAQHRPGGEAPPPLPAGQPVRAALNPDGTLRRGVTGSFDASGYHLSTDPATGQPVFRTAGAGDENWQDGFAEGTNGDVRALAVTSTGELYVGGEFTQAGGIAASYVAKWNGTAWSALGTGVNNLVYALAVSGPDLYAGGRFTTAGGLAASHVARWNGTAWSALGAGVNDNVFAVAASGSTVYVGGTFTTAGGAAASRVARWDGTAWSALGTGLNNSVWALAITTAGDLYAGGAFTTAGGTAANYVAKWTGTTWSALGTGTNGTVNAVAVSGADVYVGGLFTTAGGMAANYVARWSSGNWSALGTGVGQAVSSLIVSGQNVYVGGDFTTAGGTVASRIAQWNGTAWSALGAGVDDSPLALAMSGTDLYVGGQLVTAGSPLAPDFGVGAIPTSHIGRWNSAGWSALGRGINGRVFSLAVSGTDVYVGGQFTTAGSVTATNIAKWTGTTWSALGSGLNGVVYAIAVSGTTLYAGGQFTNAGGVPVSNVARWNGTSWSPLGTGLNAPAYALAASGTDVYAGGPITTAGGVTVSNVAHWNGTTWSALGAGVNGAVYALAISGTDVYAGGEFTTAGGGSANHVARWDGAAWNALGTGVAVPSGSASVLALAVSGTNVYVGGYFATAGGTAATNVAKWNGAAWSALGSGTSHTVTALAASGTSLYAGGGFTTAGGAAASRVAKWNGSTWSALGTGANYTVWALAVGPGTKLNVGGDFTAVGDNSKAMPYFGIYAENAAPVVLAFTPDQGAPGTSVVITGSYFTGATAVKFNMVSATFVVNSATQITATVPATATTGRISVTSAKGTGTSTTAFTLPPTNDRCTATNLPVLSCGSSLTGTTLVATTTGDPTAACGTTIDEAGGVFYRFTGTGGSVTLSTCGGATNFDTKLFVFTGTCGAFTCVGGNDDACGGATSQVTFASVAGTAYTVMVAGYGTAQGTFTLTATCAPVITSFTPSNAPTGTTVTITGISLSSPTAVTFGGVAAASITPVSATSVRAVVPTTASTGKIAVTTANGTAISDASYYVAPKVTAFSPTAATTGTTITITGSGFRNGSIVRFNGSSQAISTFVSSTTLTAVVPDNASSGAVSIHTIDGTSVGGPGFKVLPTISSFSPAAGMPPTGTPGTLVTITGTGFTDAVMVKFGTVTTSSITVANATTITATVPTGATTGKLSVTTAGGLATSATSFTVAPTITSFSPAQGAPGSVVTLTGLNFTATTAIALNGLGCTVVYNSPTQMTATVRPGATSGPFSASGAGGTISSATNFTVTTGVTPTITSFAPNANVLVGTVVTITGTNLAGATQVTFNTMRTNVLTVLSNTQVQVAVPAGATTGYAYVTTPDGMAKSAANLTIVQTPTVSSLSPASGSPGALTYIGGTNFVGVTSVKINGLDVTFTVVSAGQILATVRSGATTGLVTVTALAGTGTSTIPFTVTTAPAPTITGISPATGLRGSVVVLTGTDFTGVTSVKLGTIACAYTVNASTQITLTVPATAVTGKLFVTAAGGLAQSATNYTVILPPTISSFSPTSGPVGTLVTISGTNLMGATGVRFGGVAATSYTVVSAAKITATVPAGALTGTLTAVTIAGTATSAASFTLTAPRAASHADATADGAPVEVELYPNPATAWVEIQATNLPLLTTPVQLLDGLGRVVRTTTLTSPKNLTRLLLTGLAPGVYTVRIANTSRRLVVE